MTPPGALETLLAAGRFVVTAELTPPLAADAGAVFDRAAPLKGLVDALNVTDAAGARTGMSSLAAAALLVRTGIEPVLQLTCRDRNRIALAGELIGAGALGIPNILVLHGDDPRTGDQPEAKPVYDLDSRGVIALARQLRDTGSLPSGRAVTPPPRLLIGGADTPLDPQPDRRPDGLAAKAEAGAHFIQTQFCFDLGIVKRYMAWLADAGLCDRLKMILGVGPIASARSARWMNEKLHGVSVPEIVIERLERAADPAAEGRKLCVELIQGLTEVPGVAGVHVMAPQQKPAAIAAVIEDSGVLDDRAA